MAQLQLVRMIKIVALCVAQNQRDGLVDKTLGLSAGRSGVRIPGRGKGKLPGSKFTFCDVPSLTRQQTVQRCVYIGTEKHLNFCY